MAGNKNNKKKGNKKRKAVHQKDANHRLTAEHLVRNWTLEGLALNPETMAPESDSDISSDEDRERTTAMATRCNKLNEWSFTRAKESPYLVDLHTHSTGSDGRYSPRQLVARASQQGVRVLALTDHDTMAGVEEALIAGSEFGVRIIPGVEISASATDMAVKEDSVHILGYYGRGGPCRAEELAASLAGIREGRYKRMEIIVEKLKKLGLAIELKRVLEIAGAGVAPGRPHVAQALVETGHVATSQEAFSRYLYNGGPAYTMGAEIPAEEAVRLVCRTGGVAVLAHPWCLKSPQPVIERLKAAGLHGLEAHRDPAKLACYGGLAEKYGLLQLGGSDYHGTGDKNEVNLGANPLPARSMKEFLEVAKPLWEHALEERIRCFGAEILMGVEGKEDSDGGTVEKGIKLGFTWEAGFASERGMQLSGWMVKEDRATVRRKAESIGLQCETERVDLKKIVVLSTQGIKGK